MCRKDRFSNIAFSAAHKSVQRYKHGAIATKIHTPLEDLNSLMAKIDNDNIKVDKYSSNTNTIT
mgnify:CR=1 FL=1